MLRMEGITKSYGAVRANRGIDLAVGSGRIVGLLGENGSGKTTLMNVLFGMVRADAGHITFKGRPLRPRSPRDAIAAGIGMIHQHFMLVPAMTVTDNVMLALDAAGPWLRPRAVADRIREVSRTWRLEVDPEARVGDLPLGLQQRVEILKAILRGAELLILDEPTSNLSPPEVTVRFTCEPRRGGPSSSHAAEAERARRQVQRGGGARPPGASGRPGALAWGQCAEPMATAAQRRSPSRGRSSPGFQARFHRRAEAMASRRAGRATGASARRPAVTSTSAAPTSPRGASARASMPEWRTSPPTARPPVSSAT